MEAFKDLRIDDLETFVKVAPNGEAYVSWHLETGSCVVVVDEYEDAHDHKEDDDEKAKLILVATGVYNLCLSPDSVNVMRSCYTVAPRYQGTTTGGNISQVSSHGVLITNLCAGRHVRVSHMSVQDIRDIKIDIVRLRAENAILKSDLRDLVNKVEEIYYAPGMPGYLVAEEDFLEHCNK